MKTYYRFTPRSTNHNLTNQNCVPQNRAALSARFVLVAAAVVASGGLAIGYARAQTVVPSLPGTTVVVTIRPSQPGSTPAAIGGAVNTPISKAAPATDAINVLVLALDEADIKSARAVGITRVPTRPAPVREEPPQVPEPAVPELPKMAEPEDNAAPPAMLLPPPPMIRPRVPAGEMEVPAITPASFFKSGDGPLWRALAQLGPMQPMSPPRPAPARPTVEAGLIPNLPNLPNLSAPNTTVPGPILLEGNSVPEMPSRRPAGRAQLAAAPLRRTLSAAGLRDVLTTPLDGPSIVRSVIAGRLSTRILDSLRFSTGQMLESGNIDNPDVPSPLFVQARQKAIQAASRIGLSLDYRAVVVLALTREGEYSYLLVDTAQETGESFFVPANGATQILRDQNAAGSAGATLTARLGKWAPFTSSDRAERITSHMESAQTAIDNNDLVTAQDQLNQVVALDPSYADAYILLGDVLQSADPVGAASAYQRAAEINTRNGGVWSKIALVHTMSNPPDWIRSLSAANKALQLGYDSANLRTAMAASEFGRAEMMRRGGRTEQAEDTELLARRHLDRARELAPDDPEVAAGVSRLMAKYLLDQKRYKEAVQALDLLATQYPDDLPTQKMYALALEGQGTRLEDLFLAWARVWKLSGESEVLLDATRYARIADGFDQRLVNISKNVFQMTSGVATGGLLRETAILQTNRSLVDLTETFDALRLMRPPVGRATSDAHVSRLFAADLMQQAMGFYSEFLETGQEISRGRAVDLHRQAIESLNNARAGNIA